jgi:hypothetical protein
MDILLFSTATVYKYLWIRFPTLSLYLQRLSTCPYTLTGIYHNNSLYLRRLSTCPYTLTLPGGGTATATTFVLGFTNASSPLDGILCYKLTKWQIHCFNGTTSNSPTLDCLWAQPVDPSKGSVLCWARKGGVRRAYWCGQDKHAEQEEERYYVRGKTHCCIFGWV